MVSGILVITCQAFYNIQDLHLQFSINSLYNSLLALARALPIISSVSYYSSNSNPMFLFHPQTAYNACSGNFVNVDMGNAGCEAALQTIEEVSNGCYVIILLTVVIFQLELLNFGLQLVRMINLQGVLEPECSVVSPKPRSQNRRSLREDATNLLLSKSKAGAYWCRVCIRLLCIDAWAFINASIL